MKHQLVVKMLDTMAEFDRQAAQADGIFSTEESRRSARHSGARLRLAARELAGRPRIHIYKAGDGLWHMDIPDEWMVRDLKQYQTGEHAFVMWAIAGQIISSVLRIQELQHRIDERNAELDSEPQEAPC